MDDCGCNRCKGLIPTVRKKRSQRRRRIVSPTFPEFLHHLPLTSLSDYVGRFSSDKYADHANAGRRSHNLNYSISRDYSSKKKKEDGGSTATYSNAHGGDDTNPRHGTSLRQSRNAGEGVANDSKMKLKVGEVRGAIQTKNSFYGSSSLFSSKSARPSDASEPRQNLTPQDNSSVHGPPVDKKSGSNRISCEDFPGETFGASKSDLEKVPTRNVFEKQGDKPHQNRKSQRVPRRVVLDELDEDEYADDANVGGRIYNLNYSISRDSFANRFKGDYSSIKKKEDGGSTATYSNARGGDDMNPGHGTSLRQSGNAGEGVANDSKMKLKVGEVRGAIQTKNSSYGSSSLFSSESARPSDASEPRQNLTSQDNSSVHGPPADKKSGSNRISCEDFPGGTFGSSKSDLEKVPRKNVIEKQGDKPHQNRKSQRVPRRLILDELDEDEYADDANVGGRIYNLNYSISRDSSANRFKGDYSSIKKKEDGGSTMTYSNARGGDDMNPRHGTYLRQSGNVGEGVANDSKMNLKDGEVRHASQIKNSSYGSSSSLFSSDSARPSDASELRQNLAPQDNSNVHGPPVDKKSGSNRISCEDFPGETFGASKSDLEKVPRRNVFEKQGDNPHQNRKSQRVPRRLVLDELDEDEYADDANVGGRIYNLNYSISRDSFANRFKGVYSSIKKKEDEGSTATYSNARGGDDMNPGHGTSLRQSGNAGEGVANDSKMKLKVGEVRGAIQTKNSSYGSSSLFSSESTRPSDASEPRQNLTPQDNSNVHGPPADEKSGSNRISCEDFPGETFGASKSDLEKVPTRNVFEKQGDKPHQNRKSQRVPRRLVLDELDEDEYADDANVGGRIYNLNYSISRDSFANRFKGVYSSINKKEDGGSTATYSNARGGDDINPGHGTSLRQSRNAAEGVANDSKMKLKVGEVRGAIQSKNSSYGSSSLFSFESTQPSDASEPRQNLTPQDNPSEHGPPADKKSGSKGISCEDFPGGTFGASKSDLEKVPTRNVFEKQGDKPHQNRKTQRVPRRVVLDELDEDEYADDANVGGRIYNLNYSISRDSFANRFKGVYSSINKEDGGSTATYSNARGGDDMNPGHGTSLRQSRNAGEGVANDSKMKLKVGEVRGAIQSKNSSYGSSSLFSSESTRPSDASEPRQNLTPQDNPSEHGPPADKKSGSKGISCEDFPGGTFGASKSDLEKMPMRNVFEKHADMPHQNRKRQRVPRRLVLDGLDDDNDDDEIHYLVKLNTSKVAGNKDLGEGSTKTSGVLKVDKYDLENIGRSGKEVKRKSHRGSEEELLSDGEAKRTKKEKQMKESSETPVETKSEINLTARQRALLSRRDSSATSVNQIEFPNGLPPAPPRKQKEKLSEVEQQLKKAEAARKRKIQYEKAARESEAEAIRKILGHDRKKREEETKKKQEELAQKRVAKELASNTIRTVIGPAGTTVTFSHDIGLPSIFDSKPCSYPPPREKCAGPSCVNTYKYRDSKSNLPLCSLKCYKAIHEKMQDEKPC